MFSARASLASLFPMLPNPTMPRYFPASSVPMSSFFIQLLLRSSLSARGMSRAIASINPITNSATAFIAPSTALITRMFFSLAVLVSILSRPTPTRAIILHLVAFSTRSFVMVVLLRTTIISKSPIFFAKSSGVICGSYVTARPFFLRISIRTAST